MEDGKAVKYAGGVFPPVHAGQLRLASTGALVIWGAGDAATTLANAARKKAECMIASDCSNNETNDYERNKERVDARGK